MGKGSANSGVVDKVEAGGGGGQGRAAIQALCGKEGGRGRRKGQEGEGCSTHTRTRARSANGRRKQTRDCSQEVKSTSVPRLRPEGSAAATVWRRTRKEALSRGHLSSPSPLLALSSPTLLPLLSLLSFSLPSPVERLQGAHCHAGTEKKNKKERHPNGRRKELSWLITEIHKGHHTSGTTLHRLGPTASFDLPCKQKGVWWCDAMAWKSSLLSLHFVPHM